MTEVLAPCAGAVRPLSDVPDPVFAQEIVGPGVAIEPVDGLTEVTAPVSGRLAKLHPHAFVIAGEGGIGVLVHLGIDTIRLQGKGFTLLVAEGDEIAAGTSVVRWNPEEIAREGLSTLVPVIALGRPKGSVTLPEVVAATAGELLFTL